MYTYKESDSLSGLNLKLRFLAVQEIQTWRAHFLYSRQKCVKNQKVAKQPEQKKLLGIVTI